MDKMVLCIIITLLVWTPFALAGETFYSALESKESVEKEGGTVTGGRFVPGKVGNGFFTEKVSDIITFPSKDVLNLKAGTVEMWVKMGWDVADMVNFQRRPECFLFTSYKRPQDAIFLQFEGRQEQGAIIAGMAGMRIKSANKWYDAYSDGLDWKKDEIHHMAGTWGPDGIKLHLDGELAATHAFTGGPTLMAEIFTICNMDDPEQRFFTACVVDEVRVSNHQKKLSEIVIAVFSRGKLSTTWGKIRGVY